MFVDRPLLDNFLFCCRRLAFSFGDFSITDEHRENIFFVEGSWPMKFYFKDKFGRNAVDIKKRSFIAIEPSYDFYQAGTNQILMSITRRIAFMGEHYDIDSLGDQIIVQGDIFAFNFTFVRKRTNETIAIVDRQLFTFTDTYNVEIAPTENIPLLLACVIIIEYEEHRRRR